MKSLLFHWGLLIVLGVSLNACTQPGIIGSNLLEGDQIGVGFTDTLPFIMYLQPTDSVKTYDTEIDEQLIGYLCGQFRDPVFGLSEAIINAQLGLNAAEPPDFEGGTLDSMVMILPYRSTRVYGDTMQAYEIKILLLDEEMNDTIDYFSNKSFEASQLMGVKTVYPKPNDSLEILIHGDDTLGTQKVGPQLRIRLDETFAQSLFAEDTLVLESDSSFLEKYKGIQIRSHSENNGILNFSLLSTSARLAVYYHTDTIFRQYSFRFSPIRPRMVNFTHDYTGTPVEPFLQDSTLCDSLVFGQGMSGLGIVVEIPDTEIFEDKIINRAELELSVISLPEDVVYPFDPIEQFLVSEILEDGSLQIIPDVSVGLSRQDLALIFGGNLEEENSPQTYKMNLSAYFKELKNGEVGNRLLITPLYRAELANRVVLCGPKHPDYPAKIKLSLTDY